MCKTCQIVLTSCNTGLNKSFIKQLSKSSGCAVISPCGYVVGSNSKNYKDLRVRRETSRHKAKEGGADQTWNISDPDGNITTEVTE